MVLYRPLSFPCLHFVLALLLLCSHYSLSRFALTLCSHALLSRFALTLCSYAHIIHSHALLLFSHYFTFILRSHLPLSYSTSYYCSLQSSPFYLCLTPLYTP